MNKIKSILFKCFLLGIFFVGTIACNDYLNEDNRSAITQENYFQNANQAQTAVNGVYSADRKEEKLKKQFPAFYRFVLEHWFTLLRHSDYTIEYHVYPCSL